MKEVPKPLYEAGSLAIFHYTERNFPGLEPRDHLFLIQRREFKTCTGEKEPTWRYSGILYEMGETNSPTLKTAPKFCTTVTNAQEFEMSPLEDLVR